MKVFITGGTGFIGSHLVDALLAEGDTEVYALVRDLRSKKWLEGREIHCLEGDLRSLPSLPHDVDTIFHLAGSTKVRKPADYYTVNQGGSASLFQALADQNLHPRRLVLLSSLAAAGPSRSDKPVRESDPPRPLTPYGRSKLAGEQEALKFNDRFPLTIIRVGPVYGPRDRDFLTLFRMAQKGIMPTFGSARHKVSLCYVKDLVEALKLAMRDDSPSGEIYNIGDPEPYAWDEFGRAVGKALGRTPRMIRFPLPVVYLVALMSEAACTLTRKVSILDRNKIREMRQDSWVADMGKAQERLAFNPGYTLEQALEETIHWYLDNNWL
jgi:nucleoside-diphosphate-sugar epimerase